VVGWRDQSKGWNRFAHPYLPHLTYFLGPLWHVTTQSRHFCSLCLCSSTVNPSWCSLLTEALDGSQRQTFLVVRIHIYRRLGWVGGKRGALPDDLGESIIVINGVPQMLKFLVHNLWVLLWPDNLLKVSLEGLLHQENIKKKLRKNQNRLLLP